MNWLEQRDWAGQTRDDIGQRLASLGRDVAVLSRDVRRNGQKMAERYGRQLQDNAGDIGEALMEQGTAVAREVGRQAQRAGRAVRNDPLPAIAAAVALVCVASLVLSRRR